MTQDILEKLKRAVKDTLTPTEFEKWEKDVDNPPEDCLIRKHFEEEMKKPSGQRSYYAYLSCKCSRCNPGKL